MVHPAYLGAFEFVGPGQLCHKIEYLVFAFLNLAVLCGLSKTSPGEALFLLPSGYRLSLMP